MYNEIWKSVEALLKPLHRMSDIITIPDLTLDLVGLLRVTMNESQYSDTSKYKRIIKQEFEHPLYQIINIVFDFDDEDAEPIIMKLMYEGKLTLFTIVPYNYITDKNGLDGPIPNFMLRYFCISRQITRSMTNSAFTSEVGSNYLTNISLHSIPLLFTKWMTSMYGMDKEVTQTILTVFKEALYPAKFTAEHIGIYMDLFTHTSVEKLLDYSYIATEEKIINEAYVEHNKPEVPGSCTSDEEEGSKDEENIPTA